MTNLVPGFTWHPIDVSGRARRSKGRGLIAHVAVSESTNLVPSGTPATRSADWHFYLPKSGPGIQYIDLDYQCWSSAGANATCPAFESQGGVNGPQTEPWTDNQLDLAAQILAHLHKTEGTPLQIMPNSLPTSKGIAPHRWGINPWRVPGGEVWSSSNGKVCPGDVKVSQLPLIVLRAAAIVNGDDMPLTNADIAAIWNYGIAHSDAAAGNAPAWLWLRDGRDDTGDVHGWLKGEKNAGNPNGYDNTTLIWAQTRDTLAAVAALKAQVAALATQAVDPVALATALLADDAAVTKLGDAIAAGLAKRVGNG